MRHVHLPFGPSTPWGHKEVWGALVLSLSLHLGGLAFLVGSSPEMRAPQFNAASKTLKVQWLRDLGEMKVPEQQPIRQPFPVPQPSAALVSTPAFEVSEQVDHIEISPETQQIQNTFGVVTLAVGAIDEEAAVEPGQSPAVHGAGLIEAEPIAVNAPTPSSGGVLTRTLRRRYGLSSSASVATRAKDEMMPFQKGELFMRSLRKPIGGQLHEKQCELVVGKVQCESPWSMPAMLVAEWNYWANQGLASNYLWVNSGRLLRTDSPLQNKE